jgi:glutamyl-tRNA synthetase
MNDNGIRARFPPSPTGYLHVGGARTALFNWLFVRQRGGKLVLRIEDTDRDRSRPEHTEAILRSMSWLGLNWDEGPFFQSDGVDRHRAEALRLLAEGTAYRDFTSPEALAAAREEQGKGFDRRWSRKQAESVSAAESDERAAAGEAFALRFLVPDGETVWHDMVHEEMRFQNAEMEDLVILRSDGSPTYNLAVVSDDADQRITHVIRGDDHLSNTPKQIQLYNSLGFPLPVFGHLPIVLGTDGKRLSKRHGATSVEEYAEQGILPEALVNFLALIGWNPGDEQEYMPTETLVERFSTDRVLRKSGVFDLKKLDWLSGQYFNAARPERLEEELTARLVVAGVVEADAFDGRREWYHDLINTVKSRARNYNDLAEQAIPFVRPELEFDEVAVQKHWVKNREATLERLRGLQTRIASVEWTSEALDGAVRGFAEELGVGLGQVIHPMRVALTGRQSSPGIFDVLLFLGRETSLKRLESAISMIPGLPAPEVADGNK